MSHKFRPFARNPQWCELCGGAKSNRDHHEEETFDEWWDEAVRLAQIYLGSGDYWVSKGIAEKAWNAAKGVR